MEYSHIEEHYKFYLPELKEVLETGKIGVGFDGLVSP